MELQMKSGEFIVSKTDLRGNITYGNETFIEMSGYVEEELLSAPHNILRHEDIPKAVFKLLWERIAEPEGVFAYVTPSFDSRGNKIGYYSVRRRPAPNAIALIEPLYRELLQIERQNGVSASQTRLNTILTEKVDQDHSMHPEDSSQTDQ